MIEIPRISGYDVRDPLEPRSDERFCGLLKSIFIPEGVSDDTVSFVREATVGFLLYTNAHPEFRGFMQQTGTWEFLDSLTRKRLFIFSVRPSRQGPLENMEEKAMEQLADLFDVPSIHTHPHLVLCDVRLTYSKDTESYEHVYDAHISDHASIRIGNLASEQYVCRFRRILGDALRRVSASHANSQQIARALSVAGLLERLERAVGIVIQEDSAKKLAAAWVVLGWRPRSIQ